MNPEDEAYALKSSAEQQRRREMLTQPHMQPLMEYLNIIRSTKVGRETPNFDPCDGGANAKALFLLEAPSRKAVGSTFISRNNPDPTAKNMCCLMSVANIARQDTLLWNIVPWYIGDENKIRAANKRDIDEASRHIQTLLDALPKLKVIILVGKNACSARKHIEPLIDERTPKLTIIETHHMSNQSFNPRPGRKAEAEQDFIRVAQLLEAL